MTFDEIKSRITDTMIIEYDRNAKMRVYQAQLWENNVLVASRTFESFDAAIHHIAEGWNATQQFDVVAINVY